MLLGSVLLLEEYRQMPTRLFESAELSVSPIAYAMKSPILLVKPNSLPDATIDVIEALTGLDFFPDMDDDTELRLEDLDTLVNWERLADAIN